MERLFAWLQNYLHLACWVPGAGIEPTRARAAHRGTRVRCVLVLPIRVLHRKRSGHRRLCLARADEAAQRCRTVPYTSHRTCEAERLTLNLQGRTTKRKRTL